MLLTLLGQSGITGGVGAVDATLGAVTLTATGELVSTGINGSLTQTLDGLSLSSDARLRIAEHAPQRAS